MTRPTISDIWASTGSAVDPGTTKVNTGWAAEIPPFETQNFWQNRADLLLKDIETNGLMTWDALTTYRIGSWVMATDDESYRSITAVNIGNNPVSSPLNWISFSDLVVTVNASETVKGIAEIATDAETQAGADDTRIVTPKKLKDAIQQIVPDASTATKGKVELASNSEAQVGTDTVRAVTPASLASVTATETRAGLVERATDAEAISGADTTRYVTPKQIKDRINALVPTATIATQGKVELATNSEVQSGADGSRAVTPASLASLTATETRKGLVEKATVAESQGFDNERYVTPNHLNTRVNQLVPNATEGVRGKAEIATQAETNAGTDDVRFITPKKLNDYSKKSTFFETVLFTGALKTGAATLTQPYTNFDALVFLTSRNTPNKAFTHAPVPIIEFIRASGFSIELATFRGSSSNPFLLATPNGTGQFIISGSDEGTRLERISGINY